MTIVEPHTLGLAEAQTRIQRLLGELRKKFSGQIQNVQEEWTGNKANFSFRMMSFSVKGTLLVEANKVTLDSKLPLTATPFKGMVEKSIRTETRALLDA